MGVRTIAMASVVLYVIGGKLGEFARIIQPDNFRNLATFLSLYLLVLAYRREKTALFGFAGASLGVAALFYPILAMLIVALPLTLTAIQSMAPDKMPARSHRESWRLGAFALGGFIVVAPWMARNLYLFGDPMLADQSEGLLLSFRVAYNAMPLSDWPIAALSWVPELRQCDCAGSFSVRRRHCASGLQSMAPISQTGTPSSHMSSPKRQQAKTPSSKYGWVMSLPTRSGTS